MNSKISVVHLRSPFGTRPHPRGSYFASISRSCFTWRSFLRNSRSSSRLSVERPSALFPSSRSAFLYPVSDGLLGRLKLLGEARGCSSVSGEFDDSVSEFIGVWWTGFWHGLSRSVSKVKECPPYRVRSNRSFMRPVFHATVSLVFERAGDVRFDGLHVSIGQRESLVSGNHLSFPSPS